MFNRDISLQIDAIVILLDAGQPFLIRLVLRYIKRRLERAIS